MSMSKLFLILYMLISAMFSPILCQNKNIAIVSNLNYNGKINRNSLDQFTLSLNKDDTKIVALIISSLSNSSSIYELNEVETAFADLKMPFKIIGGHLNSIDDAIVNPAFERDDFLIPDNDKILTGINSVITYNTDKSFLLIESLNTISEENDLNKFSTVFIFSNTSLNRIQNSADLLSLLKNKFIFTFHPTEKSFTAQVNSVNNFIEIGIPPSINPDMINYFLIEESADTIKIIKRNNKNDLMEIAYSVSLSELKKSNVTIDEQIIDSKLAKSFKLEFNSSSSLKNLAADNRLYTVLDNGLIYLNDFKGKEKFVTELIGTIKTNPVLYKDLILASTFEGDLYSINSNNGEVLQVVGIGENITSDIALTEIEITNSKQIGALLGTVDGNIFCYDAFTFEQLWKNNISKFPIIAAPLVINDKVVFLNSSSSLYCVNSKSGSLIWRYEFSDNQNFSQNNYPLSDGKNVFSISPDGNLLAIDLLLGKKNWSVGLKEILNQFYISPDKQKLFLLDRKGMMSIISAKDGKEIGKIDFKKSELFSFVITELNEETLVGFSDGSVYTFNSKFIPKEIISADQIPITSINVISPKEFVVKNIFGKITFYKIN
ncbi:MAG TPA: PQQ-binding-like beta-propeller repeat protein [Ignavibacteriaceae bacterium]|nr:PQQ-binding-like beta-propeller repeat protein [Ignavibacteriaceae bacterium]